MILVFVVSSCKSNKFGPKVNKNDVEVYFQDEDLKSEAQDFANLLDSLEYGKNGPVRFQLSRDSILNIDMVTQNAYHTDESLDYALNAISLYAALTIFKNDRVQLHISDNEFNRMRSLDVFEK